MKEFIEKLIGRLEEMRMNYFLTIANTGSEKLDIAYGHTSDAVNKTIEIVNELAEEYKGGNNGWIPCSRELPKKNGYYLVTQKRYSLDTHRVIRIETDYVQFEDGKWGRARHFEIIAWQPLPAPYKEGCEKNDNDTV